METPTFSANTNVDPQSTSNNLGCLSLDHFENEKQRVDIPDSASDEFDSDAENQDFPDMESKVAKDHKEEILKLADTEDPIKANRNMMVRKLTSMGSDYSLKNTVVPKFAGKEGCIVNAQKANPKIEEISSDKENISENIPVSNSSEIKRAEEEVTKEQYGEISEPIETSESTAGSQSETSYPVSMGFKKVPLSLPSMEGYLKKKTDHLLHPWHTRYVVLKDNKLLYYKNDSKDRLLGCLDFLLLSSKLEVDPKDPKKFMLTTTGCDKIFTFKAETEEEASKWIDALPLHTIFPDEPKRKLSIATIKNFWKHDRISEKKFLAESKTGDILLFKGGSLAAKLQRSVTRSEYDHVGLILKFNDGDIVLLEASGQQGVGLCRWSTFKRNEWHILYEKVVYRKLELERSKELIEKAESFVRSVVGKKYSISAKKLFQKKSTSIGTETPDDRTFFCSELVAACYKRMDLLPKEISSSQYLPVAFSADRKLPLLKGAKLSDERLVDFNL